MVGFKFQLLLSQVGINYQPPTAVPGGDFAKVHRSHLRFKDFSETASKGRGKKIDFFLGKSPKLWVGGGQES